MLLAMIKYIIKPTTSASVVRKGDETTAGSDFSKSATNGSSEPIALDAMIIDISANMTVRAMRSSRDTNIATRNPTGARSSASMHAVCNSLDKILTMSRDLASPIAKLLITNVAV